MAEDEDEPVALEISNELDLHAFAPRDVVAVVAAWLEACAEKGLRELRVVHGKGIGAQREAVRKLLAKHPLVESFRPAGEGTGGWGATLVTLRSR